jgi:hypothetical protein
MSNFYKGKKGGEISFYIDFDAKISFTPFFSRFVVNVKCVKATLPIYYSQALSSLFSLHPLLVSSHFFFF